MTTMVQIWLWAGLVFSIVTVPAFVFLAILTHTRWGYNLRYNGAWHGHHAVHRGTPWAECEEEPCRDYNGRAP